MAKHYTSKDLPRLHERQRRIREDELGQNPLELNSDDDPIDHGFDDSESIYADDGGGPAPLDYLFK